MSHDDLTEQAFWSLASEFIERANSACEAQNPALVNAALLEAAARFTAFSVAAASLDRKAFIEDLDDSLAFWSSRYRQRLEEHLQDYREHYKDHIGTPADDSASSEPDSITR